MHTFKYKGWYIHEIFMSYRQMGLLMAAEVRERGRFKVQSPTMPYTTHNCHSLHAAKCLITRLSR